MAPSGPWSGRCRWTPRSTGPISTPRAPEEWGDGGGGLEDLERASAGRALCRSAVGLTTEVQLACDGRRAPLAVVVTPGTVHDSTAFDTVMDELRAPRPGSGRPRRRTDAVIADKAYSSRAIRQVLRGRGSQAVIPERAGRQADRLRRGKADGRPPAFDRDRYKARKVVDRCFGRLERFRALAIRFDGPAARYEAGVHLTALVLRLRELVRDPSCQAGSGSGCRR